MSFRCPNKKFKSSPSQEFSDWDLLVNKIGVRQAYAEYISNGEDIPDYKNYTDTFKGVNATLKVVNALDSERANELYKRFYSKGNTEKFYQELTVLAGKKQVELLKEYNTANSPKSIADMISGILSEMSYTVEIETAKEKRLKPSYLERGEYEDTDSAAVEEFTLNGVYYRNHQLADYPTKGYSYQRITEEEFKEAKNDFLNGGGIPTQYYSNLTVRGGTNYVENEISTPLITPSIKGHAQFATDNGIGWFRSDDKIEFLDKEDLIKKGIIKQVPCG